MIVLDFQGNIKGFKNVTMDKFIKKKYSNSILAKRQKIIALWNYNSFYLGDALKDLAEEEPSQSLAYRKSYERDSIEGYLRTPSVKEENNNKILKKYLTKEFHDRLIERYKQSQSIEIVMNTTSIAREVLGKETYVKMRAEFYQAMNNGIDVNGIGNALSYYSGRFLAEYIRTHKSKHPKKDKLSLCKYCSRKFYPKSIIPQLRFYYPKSIETTKMNFCQSCLKSAFLGIYKEPKTKEQMIEDLQNIINKLGYIPNQNYFLNRKFVKEMLVQEFEEIVPYLIEILPYYLEKEGRVLMSHHPQWVEKNTYENVFGS